MIEKSVIATYFQNEKRYNFGEQKSAQLFDNSIWLTTEEAALYLRKKSTHALRQMVYKGKLSARKFHGRLYFKRSELHSLIDTSFF